MAFILFQSAISMGSVGVAIAASAATGLVFFLVLRRSIERRLEEINREFERRVDLLTTTRQSEQQPAEPRSIPAAAQQPVPAERHAAPTLLLKTEPARTEEITPETLLVIAAAVTAYLGKAVRIRSARMLYAHESFNAWSQQGRAVVQASHNLAHRGY